MKATLAILSSTNEQELYRFPSWLQPPQTTSSAFMVLNPSSQVCLALTQYPTAWSKAFAPHPFQGRVISNIKLIYTLPRLPLYLPLHLMNCMDLPHFFFI